jgi:hypothetical protein
MIFPEPVSRKRLLAPLCVFIFGIAVVSVLPLSRFACYRAPRRAAGVRISHALPARSPAALLRRRPFRQSCAAGAGHRRPARSPGRWALVYCVAGSSAASAGLRARWPGRAGAGSA